MDDTPDLASIAATIGDPTRARILGALMDGRARTATELAIEGGVSTSTASFHFARLEEAGLVTMVKQGRHRYFRIATPEVARALEGLMSLARRPGKRTGPRDAGLRRARVCYDHLAGEAGVRLLERMEARGIVRGRGESIELTKRGRAWCDGVGIDLDTLARGRRPLCRGCLDWSERRLHLAGALGSALFDRLIALRYARRELTGRAVVLSPRGEAFLERLELGR